MHTFDGFSPHLLYCIFNVLRLCLCNGDSPLISHLSHMHEVRFVVTFIKTPAVAETVESCYLDERLFQQLKCFHKGDREASLLQSSRKGNPYLSLL